MWHPPGGMRTPDRGSTTGNASWTDREPASGLPRRGERSESIPPSPPYFKKSSYASTGFFFRMWHPPGGMGTPRPGFDNWQRQLDRPRACERAAPTKTPGAFLNNACVGPAGARPRDGPSNGERSESIPPHRHILRRARTHVRAFFRMWHRRHPRGRQQCLSRATRPYPPGSPAKRSAAGRMPKNNKARASPGLAHSMTINNRLSASAGRGPSARSHRW